MLVLSGVIMYRKETAHHGDIMAAGRVHAAVSSHCNLEALPRGRPSRGATT